MGFGSLLRWPVVAVRSTFRSETPSPEALDRQKHIGMINEEIAHIRNMLGQIDAELAIAEQMRRDFFGEALRQNRTKFAEQLAEYEEKLRQFTNPEGIATLSE